MADNLIAPLCSNIPEQPLVVMKIRHRGQFKMKKIASATWNFQNFLSGRSLPKKSGPRPWFKRPEAAYPTHIKPALTCSAQVDSIRSSHLLAGLMP
jgi:hypothetical protein